MFEISMDDLKAWLTDIIEENHLKAIVLFWDEFSSFFKNKMATPHEWWGCTFSFKLAALCSRL